MSKSALTAIREGNRMVIRKKSDAAACIITLPVLAAIICLPVYFDRLFKHPLFIIFYAACIIFNVVAFISLFWGKIVTDRDKKEIHALREEKSQ